MKKALTITLVAALALVGAGTVYANYCARDAVPASTILVPFARQAWDWSNRKPLDKGYRTTLVVTNVSEDAQIIHITVWTPLSQAVLDFDEVLSGYDMWELDTFNLLGNNPDAFRTSLSSTAYPNIEPARTKGMPEVGPSEPANLIRQPWMWGPDGPTSFDGTYVISDPEYTYEVNTANCFLTYPKFPSVPFGDMLDALEAAMVDYPHGGCLADNAPATPDPKLLPLRSEYVDANGYGTWTTDIEAMYGMVADKPELWLYITVDVVNDCNLNFPDSSSYFTGTYKWANVLLGDLFWTDAYNNYSDANKAVHIEGRSDMASSYFYAPRQQTYTGLEPLGTAFAAHYRNLDEGGILNSNLIVWKNHTELDSNDEVDDCGDYIYYAWDMDEHTLSRDVEECQISPCERPTDYDPNEFPLETQLVPITTANFDLPADAGWMLFVFSPSYGGTFTDPTPADVPPPPYGDHQVFALVQYTYGTFSGILETAEMANAHCDETQVLPQLNMAEFVTE